MSTVMDSQTLERLAELICGDCAGCPEYRSGSELTRFFHRVGFSNFHHDGSTRKWWTLGVLERLSGNNLKAVIHRLANPREYNGDQKKTRMAIAKLNEILCIEGFEVELRGVTPGLRKIDPGLRGDGPEEQKLEPLPPPDFLALKLEPGLGEILGNRWTEAQKCLDAEAYLAAIVLMGSLLEGMLLAVLREHPRDANTAKSTPVDGATGKPKQFHEWTLSDMINVSHEIGWIDLDVKKFSHALREFRNLIHPYGQMCQRTNPDRDTCNIGWLVVQAATNDLARLLK